MKKNILLSTLLFTATMNGFGQHVGIGTVNPAAGLHVADSSVVFTAPAALPANQTARQAPVTGTGNRMMWYSDKAAFRAGAASGTDWNKENTGYYSFAGGKHTMAKGYASVALGDASKAEGSGAVALGVSNGAQGDASMALGHVNSSTADHSYAFGFLNTAQAFGSVAVGYANNSISYSGITLGSGLIANTLGQVVIGRYNKPVPVIGANNQWQPLHPALSVGNGFNEDQRSTAFTILNNGRVGIGTMNPRLRMHLSDGALLVERHSAPGDGHLYLEETAAGDGSRITFRNSHISNRFWDIGGFLHATDNGESGISFLYSPLGNNFIVYGTGNAWLRGTLMQNSDIRLKKDIAPLQNSLTRLLALKGYTYYWKNAAACPQLQTGVLAQEVEKVFPELVHTDTNEEKSVNYIGLIPHLLEAVKTLQQQVEELKKQLQK